MNEHTEVTAANLRFVRGSKGMTQEAVAEILGIPLNAISKIESGTRALADSEKKLLDLFFFGILPSGIVRVNEDLGRTLDFTEEEWTVVRILAQRSGKTPEEWIKERILDYLAMLDRKTLKYPDAGNKIEAFQKAAEQPGDYEAKKTPGSVDGPKNAPTTLQGPPPSPSEKKAG